ncbi:MAG: LytTR family transcriptional regulator [Sneathiella sp.]|nr:LytTR family transcriptional regulator [Sneathiella sp.]
MLEFLSKQIPYNSSFRKQFLIGAFLGGLVTFIMIFLQPFDTNRFESNHKYLIFSGFGLLFLLLYLICVRMENLWYNYKNKKWRIKSEIVSFITFVLISSIPIHFYNQVFLNDFFDYKYHGYEYLKHGLWFFRNSIIPVMLILLPFYVYFRNKFGELITSETLSEVVFCGINKGEKIILQKEKVLFIKASENYVEIYHTKNNTIQHKTFRNTLSVIGKQAPFLHKSHRSYLVNISTIKAVKGNSQNAKIAFHLDGLEVPLSKSYYKTVKLALGI